MTTRHHDLTTISTADQIRAFLRIQRHLSADHYAPDTYAYQGPADLLLRHGRPYDPHPFPARLTRGTPCHCFDNAFTLARRSRGRLRYAEGYAAGLIPVEHAWCLDDCGRVVDPTWDDGVAYFGVELPLEAVRAARRDDNLSALFDWMGHHPLCRKGAWPATS